MTNLPESIPTISTSSAWRLWFFELWFTWIFLVLVAILPCLLFSSGLFPLAVLAFAVLLMAPATAIGHVFGIKAKAKEVRRLVIMVFVPVICLIYVLGSDAQITTNATPIVKAIEAYHIETGRYPDTLEALAPHYLVKVPKLNYLLVQPEVTYQVTDGKPGLTISSAAGGFAHFAYDFESKTWGYNN